MKFSIATVSLGGSLAEKLSAIAAAGFEGVEIFEADVLAHEGSPAEIGAMVRDQGLAIVAFQPFRDFEGMPEPQRSRGFERAKRKFALMNELGAARILVCSNVSPLALGGIDRAAGGPARARRDRRGLRHRRRLRGAGLGPARLGLPRRLGDRAPGRPSARRRDPRQLARAGARAAGRPDPRDPGGPDDLRATRRRAADGHGPAAMVAALPQLPGPGRLPVDAFMAAVLATGYDGWLSLEIFNDRFRMASPRRIAEDGERSLIWLGDRMRPGAMPPRVEARGGRVDRVRGLRGRRGRAERRCSPALGFRLTGRHRSKQVTRWTPGRDQPRDQHRARGPRAFAPDRARAVGGGDRAAGGRRRGGAGARRGAAHARLPAAGRTGRARHPGDPRPRRLARSTSSTRRSDARAGSGRSSSSPSSAAPAGPLDAHRPCRAVDDARRDAELAALLPVALRLRAPRRRSTWSTPPASSRAWRCRTPTRAVRICLNASASERTLSSRFLDEYLRRRRAAHRLRHRRHLRRRRGDAGGGSRAPDDPGQLLRRSRGAAGARARARRPACAPTASSTTRTRAGATSSSTPRAFEDRFFFEIVQRDGYAGFGAANAPIRLAAQARLARNPAMPRT